MKTSYHHNPASRIIPAGILLLLIVLLFGCNPEAKKLRKTQEYLFRHPDFSAGYCAEQYPVKDSIVTRDSIRFDTLYVPDYSGIEPADTLSPAGGGGSSSSNGSTSGGGQKETVTRYITKTITKDTTIYRRDAAEERRLQLSLQACQGNNTILLNKNEALQAKVDEWKAKAKTRWWWIIALIGAAVTYTAIKFKKNILSLKNKLT